VAELSADIGVEPKTSIETGIEKFVVWHRNYYRV